MPAYTISTERYTIDLGWISGLKTYFAEVWKADKETSDRLREEKDYTLRLLQVGISRGEIETVEALAERINDYVVIPPEIKALLEALPLDHATRRRVENLMVKANHLLISEEYKQAEKLLLTELPSDCTQYVKDHPELSDVVMKLNQLLAISAWGQGKTEAAEHYALVACAAEDKTASGYARSARFLGQLYPQSGKGRLPPRSILIVNSDKVSAEELARQLRKMGHDVEIAYDGPTALEVEGTLRPDMVIIDLGLSGMDAYTVARFIRTQPGRDVMLVSSGGFSAKDAYRAWKAGFTDHVSKFHGAVFLPSLARKLAEESVEDYVLEQLARAQNVSAAVTTPSLESEVRLIQRQEFVLRMLEAAASRFDPEEMASLIPDEFLSEIRKLADSPESDLAKYLAGYKNSIISDERRAHIVNGASRWLRFFNP